MWAHVYLLFLLKDPHSSSMHNFQPFSSSKQISLLLSLAVPKTTCLSLAPSTSLMWPNWNFVACKNSVKQIVLHLGSVINTQPRDHFPHSLKDNNEHFLLKLYTRKLSFDLKNIQSSLVSDIFDKWYYWVFAAYTILYRNLNFQGFIGCWKIYFLIKWT